MKQGYILVLYYKAIRKEIHKHLVMSKTLCIFALVMRLWRNW